MTALIAACHVQKQQTIKTLYNKDDSSYDIYVVSLPLKWAFVCGFPEDLQDEARYGFLAWDALTENELFEEQDYCVDRREDGGPLLGDLVVVDYYPDYYAVMEDPESFVSLLLKNRLADARRSFDSGELSIIGGHIRYWKPWFEYHGWGKRNTAVHEVGHILGFNHGPEGCVMYKYVEMSRFDFKQKPFCEMELNEFFKHY